MFSEGRSVSEPGTVLRSRDCLPNYPTLQQVQAVHPIFIRKGEKLVSKAHIKMSFFLLFLTAERRSLLKLGNGVFARDALPGGEAL